MSFPGLIVHFLATNNIPFSGCITAYLTIHLLKHILVASKFWRLCISSYKHSCAGLYMDTSFQLICINTKDVSARLYGKSVFSFVRNS